MERDVPQTRDDEARHAAELLELGDAFFELDRDWRIVRVNRRQEQLSQRPRSETVGRTFAEVWPDLATPESRYWREYRRCLEDRVPVEFEEYYAPLDLWTGVTAYPVSGGGIAVFFRDVTARKRAEEALSRSEARFRMLAEAMPQIVCVLAPDGGVEYVNPGWTAFSGLDLDATNRAGWQGILHRDDIEAAAATRRRALKALAPQDVELRYRAADGSFRWFLSRLAPVVERGRVVRLVGAAMDIESRKRAEEAAARGEAVLEQAGAMAHLGAWWIDVADTEDLARNPLRWSDEVYRMFGYAPGEVPATNELFFRHVHPDDRQRVSWAVARAIARHQPYVMEHRIVRRGGEERVVREHGEATYGEDGRLVRLVGAVQDITDRKRAEERLRESEQRHRALFEDVAVGIVEADERDRLVAVNGRFCEMLGYAEPGELLGRSLHEITAPEDRDLTQALNARGHAGLVPTFEYEKRYLRADGSRLWVHVNVSLIRDAAGAFVRAVGTVEDITERKVAEGEARSLAQFPMENPNPVLRATTDGRVLYVNAPARACLRTMGWSEGSVLPEPLLEPLRRVPERGTIRAHEVTTPDGRVWSFTLSASAGEGHVNAFGLEITDRKRYEDELRWANERLREVDRRKDEFLGMLSHELRNPLAPIRNALYILERAEPTGPQALRAKAIANRQLAHMTRLVDDLLDVTRIARGKVELRRIALDVATLARRTAEDHRGLMQERHLDLAVDLPERPVPVSGDETRLAQVIGNLLHNAAKFTPAGGRVTLAVRAAGAMAEILVRDTGPGIAPDVLPTLFEPFTQGKQTLARSEGGLGLGLALVKGLVTLHGGTVTARHAGSGGGTEFVVTLPFADAGEPARHEPAAGPAPAPARRRRVLVVDDNRDAAESLAQLVALLGHTAEVAYDGFAALARAATELPDVVLCDIGLPGMDGYEVARQLRALSGERAVRLVAVSGYAQPEDVARAAEAGFDAHVAKPPDPEKLAGLLG